MNEILKKIEATEASGTANELSYFFNKENISIHPNSYLGKIINIIDQNNLRGGSQYSQLEALEACVHDSFLQKNQAYFIDCLKNISREINNTGDEIAIKSKVLAELTAIGLLSKVFEEIEFQKTRKNKKTSDLKLKKNSYVEVYCPQQSQTERTKTEEELKLKEPGIVRIAISHTITGSASDALKYQSNKTIDRLLKETLNKSTKSSLLRYS